MEKQYKMCQSCGMPMSKDPQGGSTNADGTKNLKYCSYCYENGEFTFQGDVKEFQDECKKIMIAKGTPKFSAWLFTRGMKRLEKMAKSGGSNTVKGKSILQFINPYLRFTYYIYKTWRTSSH